MADKELKRYSRRELLELLIVQTKENTVLSDTVKKLEAELNDRRITIEKAGTVAEAAAVLNGLYEAADKTAKQFIENARLKEEEAVRLLEYAKKKAEAIVAEAEKTSRAKIEEADRYMEDFQEQVREYLEKHPEMLEVLPDATDGDT